jgi:hypothetical protein
MTVDLFRTVKTEGLNYEESEPGSGKALRKLLVMALTAAVQILKLRQARGTTEQKTTSVFSKMAIKCMKELMPRFGENDVSWGKQGKAGTLILKTIWRGRCDLLPDLAAGKVSPVKGRPEPLPFTRAGFAFSICSTA